MTLNLGLEGVFRTVVSLWIMDGSLKANLAFILADLPGFTRSVYKRDHALITPESHVFSPLPDWYVYIQLRIFNLLFCDNFLTLNTIIESIL